jgi:hypothetical protein
MKTQLLKVALKSQLPKIAQSHSKSLKSAQSYLKITVAPTCLKNAVAQSYSMLLKVA